MALIHVRSTQPGPDGSRFETYVDESHLERWPGDYEPVDDTTPHVEDDRRAEDLTHEDAAVEDQHDEHEGVEDEAALDAVVVDEPAPTAPTSYPAPQGY